MLISKLKLTNFRSYNSALFKFDADVVVIFGKNGAGKTNILEAITLLSKGRGLRFAEFDEMINNEAKDNSFTIFSEIKNHPEFKQIATSYSKNGGKRILKIDSKNQNKFYPSIIWLTPQIDSLFLDSKQIRRKFLDRIVGDIDPSHLSRINAYDKAIRERINLLEKFGDQEKWLEIIERQIAELGTAIAIARNEAVNYLNKAMLLVNSNFIKTQIKIIGEIEELALNEKAIAVEEKFVTRLKENRLLDLKKGRTSFGVHRSDFTAILLDKNIEAKFCSTGEQKSILIAITFARVKIFSLLNLPMPILLLDEIASHLDSKKREELFKELNNLSIQIFLTGTDKEIFFELKKISIKIIQFLEII